MLNIDSNKFFVEDVQMHVNNLKSNKSERNKKKVSYANNMAHVQIANRVFFDKSVHLNESENFELYIPFNVNNG